MKKNELVSKKLHALSMDDWWCWWCLMTLVKVSSSLSIDAWWLMFHMFLQTPLMMLDDKWCLLLSALIGSKTSKGSPSIPFPVKSPGFCSAAWGHKLLAETIFFKKLCCSWTLVSLEMTCQGKKTEKNRNKWEQQQQQQQEHTSESTTSRIN